MKQKLNEIGSEFWIDDHRLKYFRSFSDFCNQSGFIGDYQLVLSGRTAIDLVCQDLDLDQNCKVYMPSYCCSSMVFPFVRRGIKISYYGYGSDIVINNTSNNDFIYLNNYFGYDNSLSFENVKMLKDKGYKILYDRTHSLFSIDNDLLSLVDYSFCSLRKWMGIPTGAIVCKHYGKFSKLCQKEYPNASVKIEGMKKKYRFLLGDKLVSKENYLSLFDIFNVHLYNDYADYKIDDFSRDLLFTENFESIALSRKSNALYLYEHLSNIKQIKFLFKENKNIVPLFVPILITNGKRNDLKQYLIQHNIYCPVHWPRMNNIPIDCVSNDIYQQELSLLCDQRYDKTDMEKIVIYINKFFM